MTATARRVLVTGATGFIGRHSLAPLRARGFEVHAVHSRAAPSIAADVTWHHANLLDPAAAARVIEAAAADHLLHLAWYVEPGKLIAAPENLNWVSASLTLIRAFHAQGGRRCVISGSCYEYDWRFGYCSEALTPRCPDTLYGAAKHGLEATFHAYCDAHGLSGAWGRAFFMYGPFEDPRRLVASAATALLAGKEAPSSHGRQIRDYMHVQDVADALVTLLDSDAQGPFNVASGRATTIREIVETLGTLTGRSDLLRIGALPARANDAPLVVGDPAKLFSATGWTPKYDLLTGLGHTVDWWRRQTSGKEAR
jgi:nucleoside-diphosphate-sugar epimerase